MADTTEVPYGKQNSSSVILLCTTSYYSVKAATRESPWAGIYSIGMVCTSVVGAELRNSTSVTILRPPAAAAVAAAAAAPAFDLRSSGIMKRLA